MKIQRLRAMGFRGIRDFLNIEFPSSFTVITGRNGSGKSSVCDAIEFALTGSLSKPYMHGEKSETLSDYIWWRGSQSPKDLFVELTLIKDDGTPIIITRRPDSRLEDVTPNLVPELCNADTAPTNALTELCLTTIIRDEFITETSVDLRETERFRFVQNAVGVRSLASLIEKAEGLEVDLERRQKNAQTEYLKLRIRVETLIGQLSVVESQRARTEAVLEADKSLRQLLGSNASSDDLVNQARERLSAARHRIGTLEEIRRQLGGLVDQRASIETPEYQQSIRTYRSQIDALELEAQRLADERTSIEAQVATDETDAPRLATLAQLLAHGQRIGLQDEKCPLCGSALSESAFTGHLKEVHEYISRQRSNLASLMERRAAVLASERENISKLQEIRRRLEVALTSADAVSANYAALARQLTDLRIVLHSESTAVAQLDAEIERARELTVQIQVALDALEGDNASDRVVRTARELERAQSDSGVAEDFLDRVSQAFDQAVTMKKTISRAANEIGEERLAGLSPLMEELYRRLRPHADWTNIHYTMRGDLRRFVSLSVGEDLNPRFIFSSGQRRALGLAFLLAVHMSRSWCKLRSLILDDPVQHIDDYRALHLAEVLAAIRRSDRQVICTAEDAGLASLLTRRLRSTADAEGNLVTMAYDLGQGAHVQSVESIPAMTRSLLQTAV